MPSTIVGGQSGGVLLVSGNIFSGSILDVGNDYPTGGGRVGGIQLKLAASASGIVYVGLPNLSGTVTTINSGGFLSSGGLADGMPLSPGQDYFVPRSRLTSGIQSVRMLPEAAASGQARMYFEMM